LNILVVDREVQHRDANNQKESRKLQTLQIPAHFSVASLPENFVECEKLAGILKN